MKYKLSAISILSDIKVSHRDFCLYGPKDFCVVVIKTVFRPHL